MGKNDNSDLLELCEAAEGAGIVMDILNKFVQLANDFDEQADAHFWEARKFEMKADNCKESARKIRKSIQEFKGK